MKVVHELPDHKSVIDVKIHKNEKPSESKIQSCFRSLKRSYTRRSTESEVEGKIKKPKIMETSTPQQAWRKEKQEESSPDTSPISRTENHSNEETGDGDIAASDVVLVKKKTNISDNLDTTALTPPKKMDSSEEMESFRKLTSNWSKAAIGSEIIIKTSSAPDITSLDDNSFFNMAKKKEHNLNERVEISRNRSLSVGDKALDLSPWSSYEIKEESNDGQQKEKDGEENQNAAMEEMNKPRSNIQPLNTAGNGTTRVMKILKRSSTRKVLNNLTSDESKVIMGAGARSDVLNMCLTPGTSSKRTLLKTPNKRDTHESVDANEGCGSPELKRPNIIERQKSGLSQGKNNKTKKGGKKKMRKGTIYKYLSVHNPGNTMRTEQKDQGMVADEVDQGNEVDLSNV